MDARELIRRYYDEVWVKGNVDAIDDLCAPDYVDHTPADDSAHLERLKRVAGVYRDTATDVELELDVLVGEGDDVAAFWTMRWTQQGEVFGVPADGKRLTLRGAQF